MSYDVELYNANGKLLFTQSITLEQFQKLNNCSKNSIITIDVNHYYINSKIIKNKNNKNIIRLYIKII